MKKNILKRVFVLFLALLLIVPTFSGCGSVDTIHPILTLDGENYYYGMEMDMDKLKEKYPQTKITNNSYAITDSVSFVIRETEDGKFILAAYFLLGNTNAKINGITIGDTLNRYTKEFKDATLISTSTQNGLYLYGFYVYNGKYISKNKYDQYLTAARFEGAAAHEKFFEEVCVSTAVTDGLTITNMCYGDYNAVNKGK